MAKILVIEDNPDFRHVLGAALHKAGHEVIEASNGADGLKQLRALPIDLVVTDIVMDEKDGIETIIALRTQYPRLPTIAMSGALSHSALYLRTAQQLGARRTLEKPFRIEELVAAIREILPPASQAECADTSG